MEFELGIVCGRCDWYGAMGTAACQSCGSSLTLGPTPPPARAPLTDPPTSLFGNDLKPRRPPSGVAIAAPIALSS